jgi:peroxiredoxin Q/BCP
LGILRTTFIIDEKGRIARVFEKVKPTGHAAEVLSALQELATP